MTGASVRSGFQRDGFVILPGFFALAEIDGAVAELRSEVSGLAQRYPGIDPAAWR